MERFWYRMVVSGKVSIDEVPEKYRDKVREMLEG